MTPTIGKWVRLRIVIVAVGLMLVSLWITGRFFQLQILEGSDHFEEATGEYKKSLPILPVRGLIVDRRGTELAVSTRVASLVAHPKQIKNAHRWSRELAPVLGMNQAELKEILTRPRPFVWLKRHLTPEREEAFLAWKAEAEKKDKAPKGPDPRRDIDAIYLIPEAKRIYPQRALAGPILGFCDIDGKGLEGLECQFDEILYGQPKQCWKMMDARGHIVSTGEKAWDPEVMGNNLVLTIDRTIQHIAEKELAKGVEKWHAAGGMVLVMQPQTGEILAMAQSPAMDPNFYTKYPEEARRNRNVTHALEPGSTYKIFIIASALDAQVVKPTDKFHCENGKMAVGKEIIHDAHPYGSLTVHQIIQKSSNIGAFKVSTKVRPAQLDTYLKDFGFGQRSGIIFPGESSGVMRALRHARTLIDRATVAFGQGIAVSPLQLLMALSAMGNEGVVMEPLMVKEIVSPQGEKVKEFHPRPLRRVLSPQTARTMLDIMASVTQKGGTATQAAVEGFTVAGKTGTAQKLVGRAYSHSKFNALFIGMVPADKPVLAISVILDEPKGAIYGGVVSAPIFKEIASQSLRVLGYYPEKDHKKENESVLAKKDAKGKKEQKTDKPALTAKNGKDKESKESAPILGGIIPMGVAAASAQEVNFTPSKPPAPQGPLTVMPDFRGYTIRQVVDMLNRAGMRCRFEGSGLAVGQDPPPGTAINPGENCVVRFRGNS